MSHESIPNNFQYELIPSPEVWQYGTLFHTTKRWSRKKDVDRLPSILTHGLVVPNRHPELAVSDININIENASYSYGDLVYLHKYNQTESFVYVPRNDDNICFFLDSHVKHLTHEEMGQGWPKISFDEVYAPDDIQPHLITGVALPEISLSQTLIEHGEILRESGVGVYAFDRGGNLFSINNFYHL